MLIGAGTLLVQWPPYNGIIIPAAWIFLSVALPMGLLWQAFKQRGVPFNAPVLVGCLFLIYAGLLSFRSSSLEAWWHLYIYALAFCWGLSLRTLRPLLIGLGLGLMVNVALAIPQAWGWKYFPQNSAPAGLLMNSAVLANVAALCLVGFIIEIRRLWFFIPVCLPALVLTGIRSAIVALFGAAFMFAWREGYRMAAMIATALLIVGLVGYSAVKRPDSSTERLMVWRSTIDTVAVIGHGPGSFMDNVKPIYDAKVKSMRAEFHNRIVAHAHSDLGQIASEYGAIGLLLIALLAAMLLRTAMPELFAAFAALCIIDGALQHPVTALVGMVAAGHCARAWHPVCVRWDRWRARFCGERGTARQSAALGKP